MPVWGVRNTRKDSFRPPARAPAHTCTEAPRPRRATTGDGGCMSITDTTGDDSAASRLALLHTYFREHPVTGPAGRRGTRTTA